LEFDSDAFEDLAWWIESDRKKALKSIKNHQTTANCHQTRNKNPTPNPLPASDEGAKMYLI
jgi:hypothetical protein